MSKYQVSVRMGNEVATAVWDCSTPTGLKRILNIGRAHDFDMKIIRGSEWAWVVTIMRQYDLPV